MHIAVDPVGRGQDDEPPCADERGDDGSRFVIVHTFDDTGTLLAQGGDLHAPRFLVA